MEDAPAATVWNDLSNQKLVREIIWDWPLCGCGSDGPIEVVLLLLKRAEARFTKSSPRGAGFYDAAEDASERWVEFAAHAMNDMKVFEHGTSIGGSWLTDSGKLLLAFLEHCGTEREHWPEWATWVPTPPPAAPSSGRT